MATDPTTEMTDGQKAPEESSSYELFMGILSIMSIAVMIWLVFARDPLVDSILLAVDTMFCFIFLADFGRSLKRAPSKRAYLWPRGAIDLLSSLPGIFLVNLAIFRIFRLFRVARVYRVLKVGGPKKVLHDFFMDRAGSAVYVIVLAVICVILFGSIGEVLVEPRSPAANITTAGDAIWWAFVTITTVGYGDYYPVTEAGRVIGVLTMATGIAIFGVVTSLLSSFILGSGDKDEAPSSADTPDLPNNMLPAWAAQVEQEAKQASNLASEMAELRAEIVQLRSLLEDRAGAG